MKHNLTHVFFGALFSAALIFSTVAFVAFAQPAQSDGAQTATVTITSDGYVPASLKLKAGVPAKVAFTRKSDETCAKDVVIKDYGINQKLPLNETVTVEFTPRKGEFAFGCGMNMLKGKLIVE